MSKYKDWQQKVTNLLRSGCKFNGPVSSINESDAEEAINILNYSAAEDPSYLLYQIFTVSSHYMSMVALASLIGNAPAQFLAKDTVRNDINEILIHRDPDQLMEFVSYMRSNVFGRGFGSRPQKMVRKAMESWVDATLIRYVEAYPLSTYALLRLVHPRFRGKRGELIQSLLNRLSKN